MRATRLCTFLIAAMGVAATPAVATAKPGLVDQPVSFTVVNENHSAVPCPSDGQTYTLRGSLVAPAAVLAQRPSAVTLLVHGAMLSGDKLWRMHPRGDQSYDFALALANAGHAAVEFDLVGYGSGVKGGSPTGSLVCQGSEADVIHQVAEKLRRGDYQFGGGRAPAFGRVAVLGFSFGTQYAQIAAYSFPQDFDGVVLMGWAEPYLPTPAGGDLIGAFGACFQGAGAKNANGSGPQDYVRLPAAAVGKAQWAQPDPLAEGDWISNIEGDPCGVQTSILDRAAADVTGLPSITAPVLLMFGQQDGLVGWMGPYVLYDRLTGTSDKTLKILPGAGHSFFLERDRAKWTGEISDWLGNHHF